MIPRQTATNPKRRGRLPKTTKTKAPALLASGATRAEVANACDVNLDTVRRWEREPEFAAQVAALTAEVHAEAAKGIVRMAGRALAVVAALAEDEDAPHAVRLAAARDLLDRAGLKAIERLEVTTIDANPEAEIDAILAKLRGPNREPSPA